MILPKPAGVLASAIMTAGLSHSALGASAQPASPGENHTQVSLVADVQEVVPGSEFRVAVVFDIQDGWHTYWHGLNDTGMPTTIDLTLPEGFGRDATRWPVPQRCILGRNDMLDHVYEKRAVHVIPVRAPAEFGEGGEVTITADVEWLVCKEACLPGWKSLTITLPVAMGGPSASPKPSQSAPLFRWAEARTPRPFEEAEGRIRIERSGGVVTVKVDGAERLEFYPGPGSVELADRFNDAVADGDTLRLRLRSNDGTLRGVLRIDDAEPRPDPEPEPGAEAEADRKDPPSFAVKAFHIESPGKDADSS